MTEHFDVLVVGAGLSGVAAGHYLQDRCPWATYAVFEARDAIGGTWDLFRYPGVRSDSDMYTLGFSFRPWDSDKGIADGPEIRDYVRTTAEVEGIDRHIRFGLRVVSAAWSTEDARWTVVAERGDGEQVTVTCGFYFSCSGYYRYDRGHQPTFPGIDDFDGQVVHPQFWPEDFDATGQRIVVIGSGATAVTLIPNLALDAEHVTMLQRSPSYIVSMPAKNPIAAAMQKLLPTRLSGPALRWFNALMSQGMYKLSKRRPALVKRLLRAGVKYQLPKGYDIDTHFTPRYDPWDQRLCLVPDGDLFKAIRAGTASVVTDHIDTFTRDGIRLVSGEDLPADIVVSATGLEVLFGGGVQFTVDGAEVDPASRFSYKGMMLQDIPNLSFAIGYTNASWTLKCELTCQTVTRILNHMHRSGMRQCTPMLEDDSVKASPLLDLTSGYVQRSVDRMPKSGSRFPWQVHQSYLADYRAMRRRSIHDDALRFSNPAVAEQRFTAVD